MLCYILLKYYCVNIIIKNFEYHSSVNKINNSISLYKNTTQLTQWNLFQCN